MNKETAIKLFEQKQIRTLWDDEKEKWFFYIADRKKKEGSWLQILTN